MKILILSCDTGEGHNSAGRAVREAAELKGHTVEMMDMFLLSGKRTSHAVAGAYVGIVKHIPFFFGFIYKVGMLISSSRRKSPVYFANALLGKKLASYIAKHDFDIVVTPHLYPAETMTYMKKKKLLHIPAVAVGTDYTCIPFWEETDCDCNRNTRAEAFENQPCGPGLQRDSGSGRHAAEGGQGAYCPA